MRRRAATDDLERERHVILAWDARHVALDFRVQLRPVLEVFFLLRRSRRRVRNFAAFDDSLAGGCCADGAKLEKGPGLRAVISNIPVRCAQDLPQTCEVRFAARHAWGLRSRSGRNLGPDWQCRE